MAVFILEGKCDLMEMLCSKCVVNVSVGTKAASCKTFLVKTYHGVTFHEDFNCTERGKKTVHESYFSADLRVELVSVEAHYFLRL